jgi:hypothetical protein
VDEAMSLFDLEPLLPNGLCIMQQDTPRQKPPRCVLCLRPLVATDPVLVLYASNGEKLATACGDCPALHEVTR